MKLNFMWCREQDFEPRRRGSTSNWTITHKAHLDHDITCAIAHYKGVVYLKKKTGWKFHRWTFLGKLTENEHDRIPGKLIQLSILEFWDRTQTALMENSSKKKYWAGNNILRIPGHDTDRITG